MDDSQINLGNILQQAPKWTFAGDFTLLQWMETISQDLESRATKSADALKKLSNNIKSTNIALDNVANRLTTLQFGNQFVECRVQDDDETLGNFNEPSGDKENKTEAIISSKELLNTFLENNLKALRNCHERYSIDLEDSDDEETIKEKTCIYQPINPYNEKPLPYIFGSKDWHAKWHVGLYENQQDNSYSGDEVSEEFSETSSNSHIDDNESFESNTEWASSNSIDNDNFNASIEVKNASSFVGSQPSYPGTPITFKTGKAKAVAISESSSVSTTPSMAINAVQTKTQNESLINRAESTNSINSGTLSKTSKKLATNKRENILESKTTKPQMIDLFAEPVEDNENATSSSVSSYQTDKRVIVDNRAIEKEITIPTRSLARPFVDLFAEPPEDFSSSTTSSLSSSHNIKRKIVNLFDDDNDDVGNINFNKEEELKKSEKKESTTLASVLTAATKKSSSVTRTAKSIFDDAEENLEKLENEENTLFKPITTATTSKTVSVTKTSKSLFDDSEDDDDFLKAFIKKPAYKEATKNSLSKTLLFDNEINNSAINSLSQPQDNKTEINKKLANDQIKSIFSDSQMKENILSSNKSQISKHKTEPEDANKSSDTSKTALNEPTVEENIKKKFNVFNDFVSETKTKKKINLFDDLDDGDDIFLAKPRNNKEISQQTVVKDVSKPKQDLVKIVQDTAEIKDTENTEEVIKNVLKKSDSLQTEIAILDITKSINKEQNLTQDLPSKTLEIINEIKAQQEDNNEKVCEPAKQEQTNINSTPQATENEEEISFAEDNNENINSANKYKFNSVLFSDEPPEDDDQFFETLAKTPSTLNSNYNTIDLENDIFEPELPKVPVANASNNQNDSVDKFYTGLQLFSDIPPDDDDGNDNDTMGGLSSNPTPDANQTKRLHSVFYDDFNETLVALNQNRLEHEIPKHSIFNEEPPPMNEDLTMSNRDVTDHKVPDKKTEAINNDFNPQDTEETTRHTNDEKNFVYSGKRPVSKLQMPSININVQALLPGASNTLFKSKDSDEKTSISVSHTHDTYLSGSSASESQNVVETYRTAETEHILPNMTKNRVKAPPARRPSTRRARQENYRQSLVEQQNTLASDEEIPKVNEALKTDIKTIISQTLLQKQNSQVSNGNIAQVTKISSTSVSSELTKNDSLHDSNNLQKLPPQSTPETATSSLKLSSKSSEVSSKQITNKTPKEDIFTSKSKSLSNTLFADDDDEEDEDFFKHIKTSNILDKQQTKEKKGNLSTTTDSLQDLETNKTIAVTQENKQTYMDDLTIMKIPQEQHQQQISGKKNPQQLLANKLNSFFDEEDDDDGKDLFGTAITSPSSSSSLSYKERNMKAKSQFKSFLDSETDEESNEAALQTIPSTLSTTASSTNLKNDKTKPLTLKDDKSKLFSDSETDSDDLFGNIAAAKVSTKTTTKSQAKSSLFESDSDDKDDNVASKKISINKNVPKNATQKNTSLFSDLDSDEDDLFGGGAAKVIATNATNINKLKATSTSQTTASATRTSKTQTVADNPLADLL